MSQHPSRIREEYQHCKSHPRTSWQLAQHIPSAEQCWAALCSDTAGEFTTIAMLIKEPSYILQKTTKQHVWGFFPLNRDGAGQHMPSTYWPQLVIMIWYERLQKKEEPSSKLWCDPSHGLSVRGHRLRNLYMRHFQSTTFQNRKKK